MISKLQPALLLLILPLKTIAWIGYFQKFSMFTIEMDIDRKFIGLFLKIFLGMYFAFMIALVSFLSDTNELEPRFGLPSRWSFCSRWK